MQLALRIFNHHLCNYTKTYYIYIALHSLFFYETNEVEIKLGSCIVMVNFVIPREMITKYFLSMANNLVTSIPGGLTN